MTSNPTTDLKRPIRKAVFPVAGLGTRFLPATKVLPKEMLPLVDRPLIQRAVEEAREAGIEEFIFVSGRGKSLVTEHFEYQPELIIALKEKNKTALLEKVRASNLESGFFSSILQQNPKGLGHAIWCASKILGDEPFALLLPDVMVLSQGRGCTAQMIDVYAKTGGNVIAAADVAREDVGKYGILDVADQSADTTPIRAMVEKPKPADAPSTLSIVGRYILQPEIFKILETQKAGSGGEIQLTDAMQTLMRTQPFTAMRLKDSYFDCGHHTGFIEANIAFALADPEFGPEMRRILARYSHESARDAA
ncbi:MAG: UTP--glucose-1-phosphate uridylyltransferase [Rhodospirillales bacterium]|nr:UTP--glucose-1-phosphate uridylyltransferase [Alphaproteobacteria bacterium]MCB9987076.1 UTP--glucose-1-phosphate uridylyltransferase [Rhodospirillales bacterium]USO08161.1 MAG: UTP--glucose-1-phosphate uridylyltransferase [Rhodospirillales bacterium]